MSIEPEKLIVVGASAGGVEALSELVSALPGDFPGAILVAMHSSAGESQLPRILDRRGALPAVHAEDGHEIVRGQIFVARPNRHLLAAGNHLQVSTGPRRSGHRPSIDTLFESAAKTWGNRVIGVILSGALDDGTLGLFQIKQARGTACVQLPADAMFTGMPESALRAVDVDFSGTAGEIAAYIEKALGPSTANIGEATAMNPEHNPVYQPEGDIPGQQHTRQDEIAGFVCPECGGVLREEKMGDMIRYRCHVGHELSEQSMLSAQAEQVEEALWTALRVLEERAELVRRSSHRSRYRGHEEIARYFTQQHQLAVQKAEVLRGVLLGNSAQQSIANMQDDLTGAASRESTDQDV
jgi:two-component system, chemotaxis family, protein-glutamate methylesterase/glutaminase